jgi:hypothetical protein
MSLDITPRPTPAGEFFDCWSGANVTTPLAQVFWAPVLGVLFRSLSGEWSPAGKIALKVVADSIL